MIPVARWLLEAGHNVIVAAGEEHLNLFRAELKGLKYVRFQGFRPGYSRFLPQYLAMLFKTPLLLYHIIRDNKKLASLIRDHNVDIVISDNRFGCWNRSVRTVYVTHLLRIPLPELLGFLEFTGVMLHRFIINKYDYCFIPDLPGEVNLSGRLSHGMKLSSRTRYIGFLSRFSGMNTASNDFNFPHNTVILSGPEPQRSIFRKKIVHALRNRIEKTVVLEGTPGKESGSSGEVVSLSHLPSDGFAGLVRTSAGIASRSGYTTIMDLVSLGANALLVPTPGQTEQEYLAEYMVANGWFRTVAQREINESVSLPETEARWSEIIRKKNEGLLEKALNELLE